MRKSLLTLLGVGLCWVARGQQLGTVWLQNVQGVNAPDYLCDSSTRLFGPQYVAELTAGTAPTNLISVAQASFTFYPGYYFGPEAYLGYCGSALVQINIWNTNAGPTFQAAKASGLTNAWAQSAIFTVSPLGGYCCDPPCIPPNLSGLTSLRLNGPYQPPKLDITLNVTNRTLAFSWPVGLGNFMVAENSNLQTTNWNNLWYPLTVFTSTNSISIPLPTTTTFFRLVPQLGYFLVSPSQASGIKRWLP